MSFDRDEFQELAIEYLERWSCEPDGEVFFTHSSLLWPATREGIKVMLKIADPDDDEAHGAKILRMFEGTGSVRVLEDHHNIQLLEWADSLGAKTLLQMVADGEDDKATQIICDVIEQLHSIARTKEPPTSSFTFAQRAADMFHNLKTSGIQPQYLPMFHLAFETSETLVRETADTEMLLHGDIHHYNILHSSARGWLAIDPKGIRGPRAYEYANSLCNPFMEKVVLDPARMDRQAAIISERGNLDKQLLLQFTFVHAMQCAAWSSSEAHQKYWLSCAKLASRLSGLGYHSP